MFSFLSKKILIYFSLAVIIIVIVLISLNNKNGKEVAVVARGDVVQKVAVTGKVKPNQNVDLGFDKSGRLGKVYVSIGDDVKMGQVIASLESGEISADLSKAKALLLEENIKLREIKNTAPVSFADASKNLDAAIKESFADADNAVRNRVDQFFKDSETNPRFEVSITSGNFIHYFNVPYNLVVDINNKRRETETILIDWQNRILNINSDNLISEADKAINDLNTISKFLDKVAEAINSFSPADYAYETTVNNYKTAISSARSEVSGAVSTLVTAKDKLNLAPTLATDGQFESVLAQEAKVKQAEAVVASLEASLGKTVISAPFDGVVTLQDAKVGGTVTAGKILVSIISQNKIYVEANISEIHIGKIMLGNRASVNFDAFPDEKFLGEVSYIEPGDIIIDGVVNYKIRIDLINSENKIKNGLTANLEIETNKKENVLSLPLYSISKEGDEFFVNKIISENKTQKVPVVLGLSGNDGVVEILSGLEEGDMVEF